MKKPAAQTSKMPVKRKPAASGGASSSWAVSKKPAVSDGASSNSPVEKKPQLSISTTVAPQTPASDATTRRLGSFQDVTSEAELLAPEGLLLDWDGFSSEAKLKILKERARENPPAWLPSPM